jgi:hypothetical protein
MARLGRDVHCMTTARVFALRAHDVHLAERCARAPEGQQARAQRGEQRARARDVGRREYEPAEVEAQAPRRDGETRVHARDARGAERVCERGHASAQERVLPEREGEH